MTFSEGQKFSQAFEVTVGVYEGFMNLFADRNPLHVDEAYAMSKGFRGRVMYGNILNGFVSCFVGEHLPAKNVAILSQEIRYLEAVYLGDHLLLDATVSGVFESVRAVEIKFSFRRKMDDALVAKGKIQIGVLS